MNKLSLNLENCYGIKKLKEDFDFSKGKTFTIYAPNGTMKTSLAKTFRVIAEGKEKPHDQLDTTLRPIYELKIDDTETEILPEEICVIEPYNEKTLKSEEKILTLLADEATREEYLKIYLELDAEKKASISGLKKISGGSSNYESEIIESFSELKKNNIFEILESILDQVKTSKDSFKFTYNDVFAPKDVVKNFLIENKDLLDKYFESYNLLISKSDFFKKDSNKVFGTTEAKNLSESLEGDDYFFAEHKLILKNKTEPISKKTDLQLIIDSEIEKVFNNEQLKSIFNEIDEKLKKNDALKKFKKALEREPEILVRLHNYDLFRKEVWFSYLKQIEKQVEALVELYINRKSGIESIIERISSKEYKDNWQNAVDKFHERFINLPFTISIDNKVDSILNLKTPSVSFKFGTKPIEKKKLLDEVLSKGEQRAFYILNVIFEISSKQIQNKKTLFIIDDIADSFDYKNKYAIVEYLNDISKDPNFYSIILTHNFDFYRIISSRLGLQRENRLHAVRTNTEIKILQEVYQNEMGPFRTWKYNMKAGGVYSAEDAKKHIIALIPFVRNLIEYGKESKVNTFADIDTDFNLLTQLLHIKDQTKEITLTNLKEIYLEYLGKDDFDTSLDFNDKVYDVIKSLADNVQIDDFKLENKIVLAIIIRLQAEEYMWSKVTTKTPFDGSSTRKLFERYKDEVGGDIKKIQILESVNIMTPENIHINSFMYEPILDMSIEELKSLYNDVKTILI